MNTLKMAKPSAKDIAAAEELQQVLNALDQNQRWGCAALEDTPDFFQLIDDDEFDPEKDQHAQALYNKLVTLMWENSSFHNRVISGMCHVIMYEKNEIIDPDSDCIDLHPRFAEMWSDLKRETQAARYWNKRYHQVVAERDEARAKLAAVDEVITMLRRRPLPNDPFIKSGFCEAIVAVVTMRSSMNQEGGAV